MSGIFITKSILSYIETNLDKDLTLEKIAKQFNYSKFYIARAFKAHTGLTLYKYVQSRRLNEAAKKLAKTRQPIAEIALEAGYGSQQAFTRAFRHEYACAPQQYRRIGIFIPKQNKIDMKMDRKSPVSSLFQYMGGKIVA